MLLIALVVAFPTSLLLYSEYGYEPHHDPRAHSAAIDLAAQVKKGELDDCEALARFVGESARWSTDGPPGTLLNALNEFIPRNKANYPLGIPIGLVGVDHPVNLEGKQSGYREEYRKGYGPGTPRGLPHDQAHHFAPYLILGATVPALITDPFLDLAEEPETWGDINLARKALAYGRMVRDKEIGVDGLAKVIRAELCTDGI